MRNCNTHCNTHCNMHSNMHCNTRCNTHVRHALHDLLATHAATHTLQHALKHTCAASTYSPPRHSGPPGITLQHMLQYTLQHTHCITHCNTHCSTPAPLAHSLRHLGPPIPVKVNLLRRVACVCVHVYVNIRTHMNEYVRTTDSCQGQFVQVIFVCMCACICRHTDMHTLTC